MAHIVDFSIGDLAGRGDVYERALNRHVNVFFGLNGTGKTSLLRILDSAMSGDASGLGRVPFAEARVTVVSEERARAFTRSIVKASEVQREALIRLRKMEESGWLRHGGPGGRAESEHEPRLRWEVEPTDDPRSDGARFTHRYLPTSRLFRSGGQGMFLPDFGRVPSDILEDLLDVALASSIREAWREYSMEVLRHVGKAQEDGLAAIIASVLGGAEGESPQGQAANGRDLGEAYDTVRAFLQRQGSPDLLGSREQFADKYQKDPALQDVVADIESVEKRITAAMAPRERLERTIRSLFTSAASVSFADRAIDATARGGDSIGLVSLSSGEKNILRLLVEAILTHRDTLLIDEPELSLHVDWQRRLIATMQALNPDAQYILATHSPEIMADVPDECIFRM